MQAYIYSITPFDALRTATIYYNWTGVQKQVKITVYQISASNPVYENEVVTNLKQVEIPGGELENGQSYKAIVTIKDSSNRENSSNEVQFLCRETPSFQFDWGDTEHGPNNEYFLNAFAFMFNVIYTQNNGEKLNSWQLDLYSSDRVLLSSSGILYDVPLYS